MPKLKVGYVNVFVTRFAEAVEFYRDVLGLPLRLQEPQFGYASFSAGAVSLALAETDDAADVGGHTGIGLVVDDIDAAYEELRGRGVEFDMPPTKQPWGGTLALFRDLEGNVFYLDPGHGGE